MKDVEIKQYKKEFVEGILRKETTTKEALVPTTAIVEEKAAQILSIKWTFQLKGKAQVKHLRFRKEGSPTLNQ